MVAVPIQQAGEAVFDAGHHTIVVPEVKQGPDLDARRHSEAGEESQMADQGRRASTASHLSDAGTSVTGGTGSSQSVSPVASGIFGRIGQAVGMDRRGSSQQGPGASGLASQRGVAAHREESNTPTSTAAASNTPPQFVFPKLGSRRNTQADVSDLVGGVASSSTPTSVQGSGQAGSGTPNAPIGKNGKSLGAEDSNSPVGSGSNTPRKDKEHSGTHIVHDLRRVSGSFAANAVESRTDEKPNSASSYTIILATTAQTRLRPNRVPRISRTVGDPARPHPVVNTDEIRLRWVKITRTSRSTESGGKFLDRVLVVQ